MLLLLCSYKVQRLASRSRGSDTRVRQGDTEGRPGGLLVRQEDRRAQGHPVSGIQRDPRAQLSGCTRFLPQKASPRHRRLAPRSKS